MKPFSCCWCCTNKDTRLLFVQTKWEKKSYLSYAQATAVEQHKKVFNCSLSVLSSFNSPFLCWDSNCFSISFCENSIAVAADDDDDEGSSFMWDQYSVICFLFFIITGCQLTFDKMTSCDGEWESAKWMRMGWLTINNPFHDD